MRDSRAPARLEGVPQPERKICAAKCRGQALDTGQAWESDSDEL